MSRGVTSCHVGHWPSWCSRKFVNRFTSVRFLELVFWMYLDWSIPLCPIFMLNEEIRSNGPCFWLWYSRDLFSLFRIWTVFCFHINQLSYWSARRNITEQFIQHGDHMICVVRLATSIYCTDNLYTRYTHSHTFSFDLAGRCIMHGRYSCWWVKDWLNAGNFDWHKGTFQKL